MVLCQSDWPLTAKGATAIRYLDLVVHLYLVISEEMKRQNLAYENYPVAERGVSLTAV